MIEDKTGYNLYLVVFRGITWAYCDTGSQLRLSLELSFLIIFKLHFLFGFFAWKLIQNHKGRRDQQACVFCSKIPVKSIYSEILCPNVNNKGLHDDMAELVFQVWEKVTVAGLDR